MQKVWDWRVVGIARIIANVAPHGIDVGGGAGDAVMVVGLPYAHVWLMKMNTYSNGAYALYRRNK
jgi:hypothetical protein